MKNRVKQDPRLYFRLSLCKVDEDMEWTGEQEKGGKKEEKDLSFIPMEKEKHGLFRDE